MDNTADIENQNWFKDWFNSPYYHQLYADRDETEAAAFIDKLIAHLQPPQDSLMLDVACGKGRHSVLLAEKGFDVTGIDLSEESINAALPYQNDRLHFYTHDMRLPFWINYFNYAFNFFTSFGYFKTKREHNNALRTMAQSLQTNGCLVLDYLNVNFAMDRLIPQIDKEINGVQYTITKWSDEFYFFKKISVTDSKLPEVLVFTEKVAKFSLKDFKEMFAVQQLKIKEVFGDYNFNNYDEKKSPRLILIAEKQ